MDALVQFFGRLHPMVLHAPIGLLIGLVALEGFAVLRRRPLGSEVRVPLVWLVALAAVGTATTGFVLGRSGDFEGDLVDLHRILGIAAAIACLVAAVVQQRAGARGAYYLMLAVATGAMVVAGHKGAGVTHGENYLLEPFNAELRAAAPTDGANATDPSPAVSNGALVQSEFVRVVRPILEKRCFSCHGADKKKGGLALNTPEAISRGGDFGPVVTPGNPGASEIVRRLRLDRDDDDHMPPKAKSQPTAAEIKAIEDWIASGASMDVTSTEAPGSGALVAEDAAKAVVSGAESAKGPAAPNAAALGALRDKLAHAAAIAQGSNLLAVDLSVAPGMTEAEAITLLTPLRENIAEFGAARLRVGDNLATLLAKMPNLRKVDLSGTDVTDAGVKALADLPVMEDLVLTRTHLSDGAAVTICSMASLKRVYLWNSGVSVQAAGELRAKRPDLAVDLGDSVAAAAVEKETEVKLTSDAPPPGSPVAAALVSLAPVNVCCPVLGTPVDPNFALVYKGRVIGFCCRKCLGQFLEDPAKFEGKIQ